MQANLRGLQLTTLAGFNGTYPGTLQNFVTQSDSLIYAVGGDLVSENVRSGKQQFYPKHGSPISSIAVDPSGRYIASGEVGLAKDPNYPTVVVISDTRNLQTVKVFDNVRLTILQLQFSQDGRFLACSTSNGKLVVWDMKDMTVVFQSMDNRNTVQLCWVGIEGGSKFPKYQLAHTNDDSVNLSTLEFNLGSMKYSMKTSTLQLPNTGFRRQYSSCVIEQQTGYLILGTRGGEICMFDTVNGYFKAVISVGNTAVSSLTFGEAGSLYTGFQNGYVRRLEGSKDRWSVVQEVMVDGQVNSLAFEAETKSLFVGTGSGSIFLCDSLVRKASRVRSGHISQIVQISSNSQGLLASISKDGTVKVWDRGQNIASIFNEEQKGVEGIAVAITDHNEILVGFSNGNITCFNFQGDHLFRMYNSHKGGISALYIDDLYLLSGGGDGILRVWHRQRQNLITQVNMHAGRFTRIIKDAHNEEIIHTSSIDKTIVSYNLRADKKLRSHTCPQGYPADMAQKLTPEYELVTCGEISPISYWDIDVVEATSTIANKARCSAVSISRNGSSMVVGSLKGDLFLYDTNQRQLKGQDLHSSGVSALEWISSTEFAVGFEDGSLGFWTVAQFNNLI